MVETIGKDVLSSREMSVEEVVGRIWVRCNNRELLGIEYGPR
jgi:hypothetical protein